MELLVGNQIKGFTVKEIKEMPDQKAQMYVFEHEKTGAALIWMNRNDKNKTFCIGFKTTPENDTGVFHIIEHSVLNGSKKYPVKEPFVDLLKSSMQTFLNAMTGSDKTFYPVSSRNDKDFMNLMDVYLDGVFHPAIYTNPNIFYQEGWHYEIHKEEEQPVYKGVVLNEMKGAFGSVDEVVLTQIDRVLFPDNCYQYVSGGDPEHITDLSYEEFIQTHQKYYHPSNARVFLDGNIQLESVLERIDSYFSEYEKKDVHFDIPMQAVLPASSTTVEYEIGEDEETTNRSMITFSKILCTYKDVMKQGAWNAIAAVIASSNESPLKKALLEKNLCEEVELELLEDIQQPVLILTIRNTELSKENEIKQTIHDVITELVENGIDHEQLHATLNAMEFHYRESKEPAGLMYAMAAYRAWMYDGDPASYLDGTIYEALHQKIDEGWFEQLLKEGLLDEEHLVQVNAIPSVECAQKRLENEQSKLTQAKESWKDKVSDMIALNESLDIWQASEDSEEAKNSLPKLSLSDVEVDVERLEPKEIRKIHGSTVHIYDASETGIVYFNLYFNIAGIKREQLPVLGLYTDLILRLPTKKHTVLELQQIIRAKIGSLRFSIDAYVVDDKVDACLPILSVSCSTLQKNLEEAVDLITEVLHETVYTKEDILPLLRQSKEEGRQGLISSGHGLATLRANAHFSADAVMKEYVGGYTSYQFDSDLLEHYDEKIEDFINQVEVYTEGIYTASRLTASITGEENIPLFTKLMESFEDAQFQPALVHYPLLDEKKEAIVIPSQVSYSSRAISVNEGQKFDTSMRVLAHILSYEYLWTEVRVKGGAYGTGLNVTSNGNVAGWSYRDPSVSNTLQVVKNIPEHIDEMVRSGMELDSYIIGAIASAEPLLTPGQKIRSADALLLRHISYEDRINNRKKMLSTTLDDFANISTMLKRHSDEAVEVVIGNEDAINQCGEMKKYSI